VRMRVARRKSMCVIIANDKTTVFALVLIDFLTGYAVGLFDVFYV